MAAADDNQTSLFDENIEDVNEAEETIPTRYAITSYGADYPVDGLVKRVENGDIVIPTFDPEIVPNDKVDGFQRQFVWSKAQCDRFVESLLLGFPVPGIFLVKQEDGRLLVLDGQQRLRTLQGFYSNTIHGRRFELSNVQSSFRNLAYDELEAEDRRRLDDSIIHATIVRQEEPSDDQSSIYLVFERLNTGGTFLQPQEIRVALYRGPMIGLLRELNSHDSWRSLYGSRSKRLKDHEQILRFFALFFWRDHYERPMKDFLNRYLSRNQNFCLQTEEELRDIFLPTTDTILDGIGDRAFRPNSVVNAAVLDSIMVGVATRLWKSGPVEDQQDLRRAYGRLMDDQVYQRSVERATANDENVKQRLARAIEIFSSVV